MSKEISLFLFEIESDSVAEANLELTMILLIQPFHCWDYWFKLLNLVERILHNSLRTQALKGQGFVRTASAIMTSML